MTLHNQIMIGIIFYPIAFLLAIFALVFAIYWRVLVELIKMYPEFAASTRTKIDQKLIEKHAKRDRNRVR